MCETRNSSLLGKITILIVICCLTLPAQAKYGGTGEPGDPFLIETPADLNSISEYPEDYNKCFLLTNDINMAGYVYETAVIAPDTSDSVGFQGPVFTGVFDGNGHTITSLVIGEVGSTKDCLGLFGNVGQYGEIKNLVLEGVSVSGDDYIGGVVGYNDEGMISNCYLSGNINGDDNVGGLVGYDYWSNYGSGFSNCHSSCNVNGDEHVGGLVGGGRSLYLLNGSSSGDVRGDSYVGGLVGFIEAPSSILNCYSSSDVNATGTYVGGLIGFFDDAGHVFYCSSSGDVRGGRYVGGLIGSIDYGGWGYGLIFDSYSSSNVNATGDRVGGLAGNNYRGYIIRCYSTGSVTGGSYCGGLVGENLGIVIVENSFWDINTSGQTTSSGGTGLPTAQMKTQSTFTDAGWDFINVWNIGENQTYPYLRVYLAGDINKDGIVNFLDIAITADQWVEGE